MSFDSISKAGAVSVVKKKGRVVSLLLQFAYGKFSMIWSITSPRVAG
jgi:hypothetical protein